jgi:hypothetical protein
VFTGGVMREGVGWPRGCPRNAGAQVQIDQSNYSLPLALAVKAATTAIATCASNVITFGLIFRFDASSAFADLVAKNPSGATLASTPGVAALPGGVAIKAGNQIIAALGVSGSPGGDKDETCAQAGVASIQGDIASSLSRGR